MKNVFKRLAAWCVLIVLTVSMSMTVFATEVGENPNNQANRCELTFAVGYVGKEQFTDNLAVTFYDTQTNEELQFLLTLDTAFGNGKKYSLAPDTTYEVSVSFPSSDSWKITNTDGTEISRYYATTAGLKMDWQITELTEAEKQERAKADGSNSSVSSTTEVKSTGESAEVLKVFLDKTEWIANDPNYQDFLKMYNGAVHKKYFLEIDGNTEEMWDSYSLYERTIHTLLYTDVYTVLMGGNAQNYTTSETKFIEYMGQFVEPVVTKLEKGNDVYNAFKDVWIWQYDNYTTKFTVVNPFVDVVFDGKDAVQNGADFELTESEKEDFAEGIKEADEKTAAENRAEKASWKNYGKIIMGSAVSLIVLCVVGGVWFFHKRKLKALNIYDEEEQTEEGK